MSIQTASDEYRAAQKLGLKEAQELKLAGKSPNPLVLDEILPENGPEVTVDVGTMEIPSERIVGIKSAGRTGAFTPSFRPLLDLKSEFGSKWVQLCDAHMSDVGIREPIVCYEYLGDFYVQEGNKRVSVLRHFDAPRIPATIKRVLPKESDDPRIQAYYEFLSFFKDSKLYTIQYRKPGYYPRLLSFLGKSAGESWTDQERRSFSAYYQYFKDAFLALDTREADVLPEEALLLWLQLHPFRALGQLSAAELKKSLLALREDVLASSNESDLKTDIEAEESAKAGILGWLTNPDHIQAAFVHQLSPSTSAWCLGHDQGRAYLEEVLGSKITTRSYFDANTPEAAEKLLEQAVADGAQVVFTTAPLLRTVTLRAAIRHPRVQFLNCSVDQPYSSVRSYYGRVFEAKFIAGAIAGAMAQNNRIGYIASYPTYGVPASINAFALGAQFVNPRAQIELRWSCMEGTPQADFFADGIRVISNRDAPTGTKMYLDFCSYGTYLMDNLGELISLGSPVWVWGKFYEFVLRTILAGNWKNEKDGYRAPNYWLGMDSGLIDIKLSDRLPEGVRTMAEFLKKSITAKTLDPFLRKIKAQDGSVKNDGSAPFTPDQILHMDWLCENVIGTIPTFDEILPVSQPMVRELGLHRDRIPPEKEGAIREDTAPCR